MANKMVLLETQLIKFRLEVARIVFGGAWSVANNQAAADRHALIALPSRNTSLDGIGSMH